jgi:hypothetical protein
MGLAGSLITLTLPYLSKTYGILRRLKIRRKQFHGGSTPPPGTIYLFYLQQLTRDESILADLLRYKYGTASIRFIFSGLSILACHVETLPLYKVCLTYA